MAMKRKCEFEADSHAPNAKQLKCVPFPHYTPDNDVAMSDASSEASPINEAYHSRLSSDASTSSSVSDGPIVFDNQTASTIPRSAGLLQPGDGFKHHGTGCSQIPKLRMACASGGHGRRTMWSFCEQCGAISMVDFD